MMVEVLERPSLRTLGSWWLVTCSTIVCVMCVRACLYYANIISVLLFHSNNCDLKVLRMNHFGYNTLWMLLKHARSNCRHYFFIFFTVLIGWTSRHTSPSRSSCPSWRALWRRPAALRWSDYTPMASAGRCWHFRPTDRPRLGTAERLTDLLGVRRTLAVSCWGCSGWADVDAERDNASLYILPKWFWTKRRWWIPYWKEKKKKKKCTRFLPSERTVTSLSAEFAQKPIYYYIAVSCCRQKTQHATHKDDEMVWERIFVTCVWKTSVCVCSTQTIIVWTGSSWLCWFLKEEEHQACKLWRTTTPTASPTSVCACVQTFPEQNTPSRLHPSQLLMSTGGGSTGGDKSWRNKLWTDFFFFNAVTIQYFLLKREADLSATSSNDQSFLGEGGHFFKNICIHLTTYLHFHHSHSHTPHTRTKLLLRPVSNRCPSEVLSPLDRDSVFASTLFNTARVCVCVCACVCSLCRVSTSQDRVKMSSCFDEIWMHPRHGFFDKFSGFQEYMHALVHV